MATYKVIQDIEAEDKFVGPLTLKQFIFAMGGGLFAYLSFFVATKGLTWALAITLPPTLFGFFMAVPWSSEQPTDVWVLAKIRFRIKPRQRIWDQSGVQELVKITAPKVEERPLTNNLSQDEVKSRLKALSETIDSRGWIIKNAPLQESVRQTNRSSDRLIDLTILPKQVPEEDSTIPDMMEGKQGLDNMIQQSDQIRKTQIYEKMDRIRQGEPMESINQPEPTVAPPSENVPASEESLSASLKAKRVAGDIGQRNLHSIPSAAAATVSTVQDDSQADDNNDSAQQQTEVEKAQASVTEQSSPDILDLARNNDLNVSTIARQAKNKDEHNEPNEVVISLH